MNTFKNTLKLGLICYSLTALPYLITAQSLSKIYGQVTDEGGGYLIYANVLLLRLADSSLVQGTFSDDVGKFELDDIANGKYLVQSSLVGYESTYSSPLDLENGDREVDMTLKEGASLQEIVVKERKPLYVQKIDRMVINVSSSAVSAGGTALEILERSPGVIVNRQNNVISLAGKDGVEIMINGKISYMPMDAVIQLLDGMSADNIESIELITTPPAKFDAEGNAGFINIELIQRTDLGLKGSYTVGAGYGKDYRTSDNLSFNYRTDKINLFGSYSLLINNTDQIFSTSRSVEQSNSLLETQTGSDRDTRQRNHNFRLGIDFEWDRTIVGAAVNGYNNKWSMDAINESLQWKNGQLQSIIFLENQEVNQWEHLGTNINIAHKISEQANFSIDLDYLRYDNDNPNFYQNQYYNPGPIFSHKNRARSRKLTPLETWVAAVEYDNQIEDQWSVEFGLKSVYSTFENAVSVENLVTDTWLEDASLSSFGMLDEWRMAGYGSAEYQITDQMSLKTGLRYEYTDSQLETVSEGKVVDRQFGVLFPTIYLNKLFTNELTMNLSYSKRITRPTFNELAPFVILFDPNTFISGNAALQPAITNTIKYDLNYKTLFFSLQYSHQDSTIARFQERYDEDNQRLIFESSNLDFTKTTSVTTGFSTNPVKWWNIRTNLIYLYQEIRTNLYARPLNLSLNSIQANATQSFTLSDFLSLELSAFYISPSFFGSATYESTYAVNTGLQWRMKNDRGVLRLSLNDVFDSMELRGGSRVPDEGLVTNNLFDFSNRTVTISFSRNFGNAKVKGIRQRGGSADEERSRVN